MKVAIIGASGKAGRTILKELAERGHALTAIVRNVTRTTHDCCPRKRRVCIDEGRPVGIRRRHQCLWCSARR